MSTRTGRLTPTGSISPSCRARSSLTCVSSGKFADLVEKQRAAIRLEKFAGVLLGRAGEGALLMTKQN